MEIQPTGFCLKCKTQREMKDSQEILMPTIRGARRTLKGFCSVCGARMFKFLPTKQEKRAEEV